MENIKSDLYTVVVNGKPEGPYDLDVLQSMHITPGTFIRKPGMDDYKEAHAFPELRALLGFSYEHPVPQYFASFDQRLLAAVIDYFLLMLLYIFVVLISFLFIEEKEQRIAIGLFFLPFVPIFKFLYSSFGDASEKQGTAGKRLLNIKVTDMGGQRLNLSASMFRNFAKAISVIPLFFGYLYIFLNKKQQAWHDIAANTLVIKDRLI